jgi:hypothetical protein
MAMRARPDFLTNYSRYTIGYFLSLLQMDIVFRAFFFSVFLFFSNRIFTGLELACIQVYVDL